MSTLQVRPAVLDDTAAISGLFRARISTWQRINTQGQVEDVPYEALTIYERWLHGGPWMSIETAALQLSHLLLGAGLTLVAIDDGRVIGYSEAYPGSELEPFGEHLHITHFIAAARAAEVNDALMTAWREQAANRRYPRLTVVCVPTDVEAKAFYERHGFQPTAQFQRLSIPARTGQVFFRVTDHLDADPAPIQGWMMPIGRMSSARQQWETLWPSIWSVLPELRERRAHRLHFSVAGQEALVYCQPQLYLPRNAEISCWTPKPLSAQVLTAIRDWAHREGYRALMMFVPDEVVKLMGTEAEPDGYFHDVYSLAL